ncbi:MAG: KTSC domain-containing protein [Euryarchaeota archaeon]|nr:KTSC domain-containing protein [Euryarchaeota archaeon]
MKRETVSSSNISSIGHNISIQTLEIEFNSGVVYQYSQVPENIYNWLMNASSHGRYFNHFIKNEYPTMRVR